MITSISSTTRLQQLVGPFIFNKNILTIKNGSKTILALRNINDWEFYDISGSETELFDAAVDAAKFINKRISLVK